MTAKQFKLIMKTLADLQASVDANTKATADNTAAVTALQGRAGTPTDFTAQVGQIDANTAQIVANTAVVNGINPVPAAPAP